MFDPNWFVMLAFIISPYVILSVYRRGHIKKELKKQVAFALLGVMLAVVIEMLGVSLNLWNYTGGNWPSMLWVVYFAGGLTGYQLAALVMEKVK